MEVRRQQLAPEPRELVVSMQVLQQPAESLQQATPERQQANTLPPLEPPSSVLEAPRQHQHRRELLEPQQANTPPLLQRQQAQQLLLASTLLLLQ
jgi:hypothetical protein